QPTLSSLVGIIHDPCDLGFVAFEPSPFANRHCISSDRRSFVQHALSRKNGQSKKYLPKDVCLWRAASIYNLQVDAVVASYLSRGGALHIRKSAATRQTLRPLAAQH